MLSNVSRGNKIYEHRRFGYVIKTNLTADDLTNLFPTEASLSAFFVRIGVPDEGENRESVQPVKIDRYRLSQRRTFGGEAWLQEAHCRIAANVIDAEFTPVIDTLHRSWPDLIANDSEEAVAMRKAVRICAGCPVAAPCFARSIQQIRANKAGEAGIWAGAADTHRRHLLRMRANGKDGEQEAKARIGDGDYTTKMVCTRCLTPTNGERHTNTTKDRTCAGPVTSITAGDAYKAIFYPVTSTMVRAV